MTIVTTGDSGTRTIEAVGKILGVLPKIAAAVLGLTAIAYLEGWQYSSAFYTTLGAPWAFDLMTTAQITRSSGGLLFFVAFVIWYCVYSLLRQTISQRAMSNWAIFWVAVSLIALLVSSTLWGWVPTIVAHYALGAAGVAWAICAAVGIGELIAHLSNHTKYNHRHAAFLLEMICTAGIIWAPSMLGESKALLNNDSHAKSRLSQATVQGAPSVTWHIVGAVGEQILLMIPMDSSSQRRFRLVSPTDLVEIRPPADLQ